MARYPEFQVANVREVLTRVEAELVERVLTVLDAQSGRPAADGASHVRLSLERIARVWRAVESFPRTCEPQRLGARRRDLATLLDTLAAAERYEIEAVLPTRAALARAYGMAKFNFSRMLHHVIADCLGESAEGPSLLRSVERVERSAVVTLIAHDVLRSIAADPDLSPRLRRGAAGALADLWDTWATRGIREFAPLLDSAWSAKAEVRIAYGTLGGVTELFQLLRNGCDPAFVDYFSRDGAPPEQHQAFREFVFNATWEELTRMRCYMQERGRGAIGAGDVARIFHVKLERLHTTTGTPRDMFFSFREREMWAVHRRLGGLEGPKKTVEEYVMIFAIERRHERSDTS